MLGGLVGDKSFIKFTLQDVSFIVILHPWAVAAFQEPTEHIEGTLETECLRKGSIFTSTEYSVSNIECWGIFATIPRARQPYLPPGLLQK